MKVILFSDVFRVMMCFVRFCVCFDDVFRVVKWLFLAVMYLV